jgi:hypothetical protein
MPKGACRQGLKRKVEIGQEALAVGVARTGADVAHQVPSWPKRQGAVLPTSQEPAVKPGVWLAQGD